MSDKETAPGQGAISNHEFLGEVFSGAGNSNTLVHSFKGDPANHTVWPADIWTGDNDLPPDDNNYGVVSTFTGKRRRKSDFVALCALMVDDVIMGEGHVGGKVPKSAVARVKPTWAIETSFNNAQVGYKLAEPITDLGVASRLIQAMVVVVAGEDGKDPGMAGVTRYFKLPQGVNGKAGNGHRNRLIAWNPATTYTLEQLCLAFSLDYQAIVTPPAAVVYDADKYGDDQPAGKALDLMNRRQMIKEDNGAIVDITCPWVELHSEDRDDGSCIGRPGSNPELPGFWFKCHHGSCAERGLRDVVAWAREEAPDLFQISAFDEFDIIEEHDQQTLPSVVADEATFSTFTLGSIDKHGEPPQQIVEDFLVRGETSLISSQPNTGKSAFALDMATCIAMGTEWHGRQTYKCGVLYVCAESPATIQSRLIALGKRLGVDEIQGLIGISDRIDLTTPESRAAFDKKMARAVRGFDAMVVIYDTYRSATPGLAENDSESTGAVVGYLHGQGMRLNVHVMIIHHTTKAGTHYAGHGSMGALVDTEVLITDKDDDGEDLGMVRAVVLQQRGLGSKNAEFFYRIVGVETGRITNFGKPETAPLVNWISEADLVVEEMEAEAAAAEEEARVLDQQVDAVMAAYRAGEVIESKGGVVLTAVALQTATGLGRNEAARAREVCGQRGLLAASGEGSGRRYVYAESTVPEFPV